MVQIAVLERKLYRLRVSPMFSLASLAMLFSTYFFCSQHASCLLLSSPNSSRSTSGLRPN
jgi:hypothetical protein